jgi:predicted transcriptional regulator of viral defense system
MAENSLSKKRFQKAEKIFRENHGILRTSQAMRLGISPETLYSMRDVGITIRENRGVYRLAANPPLSDPDLVHVALLVPKAVVCLISALAYHQLTTQIPRRVYISLPREAQKPRLDYPLLDVIWRSKTAYAVGIIDPAPTIDGVPIRIYDREKTLADCLHYENRVGRDTVLEALKEYKRQKQVDVSSLMKYARVNKVQQRMQAYLEILL